MESRKTFYIVQTFASLFTPTLIMCRFYLLAWACLSGLYLSAQAALWEERFPLAPAVAGWLSPADFFGFEPGHRFVEYDQSVAYFQYLAEKSDRIQLEEYGRTYEDRPLLLLTISSPTNMRRLEDIRQQHLAMVEAYRATADLKADFLTLPTVTSLSYSIHGNEASSTEAAHEVAYELATTQDPTLLAALEESVVLLFICINPDGRQRYVTWYNSIMRHTKGQEPRDLEHYEPWPNGRTNHYWFDLNRDWIWGVHPESRGHIAAYNRWMPQVHVDYHEQGYDANYFTAPGATPRNQLLPDDYEAWSDLFGRANIAEFDKKGLSYFTRDRFDFFYPGYGSSYPSVMGAIGMLVEQGGIGAGRAVETEDGFVLSLRQRIYDHYRTSLATIQAAATQREALLSYSIAAWDPMRSKEPVNAYVIEQDGNPYWIDFITILQRHGVVMEITTEAFTAIAQSYRSGKTEQHTFPRGSLLIPTEQARHLLVNTLLAQHLAIEDTVMYDMSTWSAPLAYNLSAYTIRSPIQVGTKLLTEIESPATGVQLADEQPTYAYLIDYQQRYAPRALAKLWEKGYRVRAAIAPFVLEDGRAFPAGTLIVLTGRNLEKESSLSTDMAAIAATASVEIVASASGRVATGYDLANTRNKPLKAPRVAMLVEPPFDTYTSGQLFYLFDQETELPVERIIVSSLQQTALPKFGQRYGYADLNDYDVLLLPGCSRLGEIFKDEPLRQLTDWIRAGGVVVALEASSLFFTGRGKVSDLSVKDASRDTNAAALVIPYAEREQYRGKRRIPGAALRASIDTTHPLGFGLPQEVYSLKFGTESLLPAANLETVGRYLSNTKELLAAGYASEENLQHLAGNTWAGVQPYGEGKIVYLLDNPHYRMFWRGPSRMVQNAVMLLPGF